MVTNAAELPPEVADYRQEALVEEIDGTLYLTLHGYNDNSPCPLKAPFNPKAVNGIDDGDPHFLG